MEPPESVLTSPLVDFFFNFGDFFPLPTEPLLASLDFNSGVFGLDVLDGLACLILFLDLMVSVFNDIGLGRPCNFKNNPQALHNTWPVSSLLQSGVVCVLQLRHTGLVMFVLVVVVPLFTCVVVLALGCTGLASIGVGIGSCCWISLILISSILSWYIQISTKM